MGISERIWNQWLGRPYRLYKAVDSGNGAPVVLLHGLGRSAAAWQHLIPLLETKPLRIVAFDLLGFGASPKPEHIKYTIDDHARALIAGLVRARLKQPAVLVGHSMGCLIAVRVAKLRPDLVKHLVLYEMPLYAGLPDKRRYRMRLALYFNLYDRIISYRPIFSGPGRGKAQLLAEKIAGFTLSDDTWRPFIRSLKHTIMEQQTHLDIKQLKMPMDVIYGTKDRLVIRGKTAEIFGQDVANITAHNIRESHTISRKACRFIDSRIDTALVMAKAPANE